MSTPAEIEEHNRQVERVLERNLAEHPEDDPFMAYIDAELEVQWMEDSEEWM